MPKGIEYINVRPNLLVNDIHKSLSFYRDVLEMNVIVVEGDPPRLAILASGNTEIALVKSASPIINNADSASCYFNVKNVRALYEQCRTQKVKIPYPLTQHPWSMLDFVAEDPDGYLIAFGEHI